MSLRILFLLTQDLDSPAGVGRYFPLARELTRLGHRVHIAALHPNFASLDETRFERQGVDVSYVAPMHVRKEGDQKIYYSTGQLLPLVLKGALRLTRAALSLQADIIHVGKPHPMNSMAGLIAQFLRKKTVFVDCDDWEAASNRFSGSWQRRGVALFEDLTPRLARHVTTNTHFLWNRLVACGVAEGKITYLPNGLDRDRFSKVDPEKVAELRAGLGLSGKKIVAFIGSLSAPSHPVSLLLDAFRLVREARPESLLLIVGGGEELRNLQAAAETMSLGSSVIFTGRVPPEQAALYYRLADVLVDPVLDDVVARSRLPLKLFESWASETPFVTGDVGDRHLVLRDPPAGALARPGDPGSFAAEILKILGDSEYADCLRGRGLEYVQDYSWDRLAQKIEKVYLSCVNS